MEPMIVVKQGVLFAHLLVFALAISNIIVGDWRLLRSKTLDLEELHQTARVATWSLVGLWLTGAVLVFFDIGFDFSLLLTKPKMLTKIMVVTALTANGLLLHAYAFPQMQRVARNPRAAALLCSMLGAISTVSWLYASFVGVARLIAPQMTLGLFLDLYLFGLIGGLCVAVLAITPMLEQRMRASAPVAFRRQVPTDLEDWETDAEGTAISLDAIEVRKRT